VKQGVRNVPLHLPHEFPESALALRTIHRQRVALTNRLQADAGTQVFHVRQVVDPVGIYGTQQQQAHQRVHVV
jgi:hypothetical protein